MPVYCAVGDALVKPEELSAAVALQWGGLADNAIAEPGRATLTFPSGEATPENSITHYTTASGAVTPFVPVGLGKPLTIEIRHVYTGRHPEGLIDRTKDMLVTSALRSTATFARAPRAINFLRSDVSARRDMRGIAATEEGTPLLHYTSALVERASVLTLEIAFDEFPDEFLRSVSKAFVDAAGLPVFLSAGHYLLAASAITNILGAVGSRLFDRGPVFAATVPLDFLRPGAVAPVADFRLVMEEEVSEDFLKEHRLSSDGILTDMQGNRYAGDYPYVVISLDGRENDAYRNFTPTAAGAALLGRFFGVEDREQEALGPLFDALKLYNDWTFRQRADQVGEELARLKQSGASDEERKQKEQEYDALIANIQNAALKPGKTVP